MDKISGDWVIDIDTWFRTFQYESERALKDQRCRIDKIMAAAAVVCSPGYLLAKMKEEGRIMKQETCKYDWSCLIGTEWQHCDRHISNGYYYYHYENGGFTSMTGCPVDPCRAKIHYLNACEVIERCKIDWWKSCERVCKRLGIEVARADCSSICAFVRTEYCSDNHGALCVFNDFTFKLHTSPGTLTRVMMLAEVAKALIECGWKERC